MRSRLGAVARLLVAAPPRAQALVVGLGLGLVMLIGSATTTIELPWDGVAVPAVTTTSIACSSGDTVGVAWQIDPTKNPPPVNGVVLSAVPAQCASLPITVSITDGTGGILASVTRAPGAATSGTATWDFSGAPGGGVPIPPIQGLRVDVPDPIGAAIPIPTGTDVTIAATYSDGTFLAFTFPAIGPGGSVTVTSGDSANAITGTFALSSPTVYFDVATTGVTASGATEVCVYLPDTISFGTRLPRLFHYSGGAWVDTTTSWDPATRLLCGSVSTFSPFALGVVGYDSTTASTLSASSVALGGSVTATTTVVGDAPRVGGGAIDPTGGTTYTWCYAETSAGVATCTAAETDGTIGTVSLAGGPSPSDGTATATSATFTPTTAGWYRIRTRYAGNGLYLASEQSSGSGLLVQVGKAPATVVYLGDTYVPTGTAPTLAAQLSSSLAACAQSRPVRFVIDANGNGIADASEGTYATGTTDATGNTTVVGAAQPAGIYELVVVADETADCALASVPATLTVGGTADSSNGGGWYTVSGAGRVNFGYTVSLKKTTTRGVTTTTVSGRLLWMSQGKFKLNGAIANYYTLACPAGLSDGTTVCGALVGTGTLYRWDGVNLVWVLHASNVSYTVGIADGGSATTCAKGKNGKCTTSTRQDWFRMDVPAYTVDGETAAFQPLKGGNLIIR